MFTQESKESKRAAFAPMILAMAEPLQKQKQNRVYCDKIYNCS